MTVELLTKLNVDRFIGPRRAQGLNLIDHCLQRNLLRNDLGGAAPATARRCGGLLLATSDQCQKGERYRQASVRRYGVPGWQALLSMANQKV
jgi:hypothetical protein